MGRWAIMKKQKLDPTDWACSSCKQTKPIDQFYKIGTTYRIHAKCKPCFKAYKKEWLNKYPDKKSRAVAKTREWRDKVREDIFAAYGGKVCACCGETEIAFLQLDHINGGGTAERKRLKADSVYLYYLLRQQGFPPGYRILCANCNWGRRNIGVCPHEKAKCLQG